MKSDKREGETAMETISGLFWCTWKISFAVLLVSACSLFKWLCFYRLGWDLSLKVWWTFSSPETLNPDANMWHCLETQPGRVPAAQLETSLPEDTKSPAWDSCVRLFLSLFLLETSRNRQERQFVSPMPSRTLLPRDPEVRILTPSLLWQGDVCATALGDPAPASQSRTNSN